MIIFIMGDDIGWFDIGAYNQGIMAGRTPNLDRLTPRKAKPPPLRAMAFMPNRSRTTDRRRRF
jgi:hypothetical protein